MKIHSQYTFTQAEFNSRDGSEKTELAKGMASIVKSGIDQQMDGVKLFDNKEDFDKDPRKGFVKIGDENGGKIQMAPGGKFETWQRNLEFEPETGKPKEYSGYKVDVDESQSASSLSVTKNEFGFKVDGEGKEHYTDKFTQIVQNDSKRERDVEEVRHEVVVDKKSGTITLIEDREVSKKKSE
jgi:hypothetical protein